MALIDREALVKRLESDVEQMKDPIAQMFTEGAINDIKREKEVPAIPVDWIRAYISSLKAMGVQISLRDAQAVSVMVDKWAMDNSKCGPDYCEIGGDHT